MKQLMLVSLILFIFSCKEKEFQPESTINVTSLRLRGDSIYVTGNINNYSNNIITRLGFTISTDSTSSINDQTGSSYDVTIDSSKFNITVFNDFDLDTTYFVRAFIQTSLNTFFSEAKIFNGYMKGAAVIDEFTPNEVNTGDIIKIYGSNFGNDPSRLALSIDQYKLEILEIDPLRIIAKVPNYDRAYTSALVAIKGVYQTESDEVISLYGPKVHDFSPDSGNGVLRISIEGQNFSPHYWRNTIWVGNNSANVISSTEEKIDFEIDARNILPGSYELRVIHNDIEAVISKPLMVDNLWVELTDKPEDGLMNSANFQIDGRFYFCAGSSSFTNISGLNNEVWEYNSNDDTWTKKENFPGEIREGAIGFSISNKGYIGSGYVFDEEHGPTDDFWEYDPVNDNWTEKSSIPGQPRSDAIGFSYSGNGYIILGDYSGANDYLNDFWEYNPITNSWSSLPDFEGELRTRAQITIKNDKLYLFGGENPNLNKGLEKDIWKYDFQNKSWHFIDYLEEDFNPIACVFEEDQCLVVSKHYIREEPNQLRIYKFDPAENTLTDIIPVYPTTDWILLEATYLYNEELFMGIGYAGNSYYQGFRNEFFKIKIN